MKPIPPPTKMLWEGIHPDKQNNQPMKSIDKLPVWIQTLLALIIAILCYTVITIIDYYFGEKITIGIISFIGAFMWIYGMLSIVNME